MTKTSIEIDPLVWLFTTSEKLNEKIANRYFEPSEVYCLETSSFKAVAFKAKIAASSSVQSFLVVSLKKFTFYAIVELEYSQVDGLSYDDIDNIITDFMDIN